MYLYNLYDVLNILRKFYIGGYLEEDWMNKVMLMSGYTQTELKKMFKEKTIEADYLENFLLRCYIAKIDLETFGDNELEEINSLVVYEDEQNLVNAALNYLKSLTEIANIFDDLGIVSKGKKYYEYYHIFQNNLNTLLDKIRGIAIQPKDVDAAMKIIQIYQTLFTYPELYLENLKKELFKNVKQCFKDYDMNELSQTLGIYCTEKHVITNFVDENEKFSLDVYMELLKRTNLELYNELAKNYNLFKQYFDKAENLMREIIQNNEEKYLDIYFSLYTSDYKTL